MASKGEARLGGVKFRYAVIVLYVLGIIVPNVIAQPTILTPEMIALLRPLCQSNPAMSPYCSEVAEEVLTVECKSLPPRGKKADLTNMPLDDLLRDGVIQMNTANERHSGKSSEAIFVLGNTGSGKTTVTQIIAGNLARLHATRKDGGTLVIIDDDDLIGAPTTKSKTLIPNHVIHPESGVVFWDCPGFDDNRGPMIDIAAMYFLKHALDKTTSAKFLFTVSHSSVKAGRDRNDFDLLAKHAVRLLRDVKSLRVSIGLVVTKVGGFSPTNGRRLSDDEVLSDIRDFLNTYIGTKEDELGTAAEASQRAELQGKIDFVQGILGNNRLFFVRSPEECGSLDKMASILDTKRKITKMYSESLRYSPVREADFRISLKAETLLQTKTVFIPANTQSIEWSVNHIVSELKANFKVGFYNKLVNDPGTSINSLNEVMTKLQNVNRNIGSNKEKVSLQLKEVGEIVGYNVDCNSTRILWQLESQLQFFDLITNQTMSISGIHSYWLRTVNSLATEFGRLQTFQSFCSDVEIKLARFDSQVLLENFMGHQITDDGVLRFLHDNNLIPVPTNIVILWEGLELHDKQHLAKLVRRSVPKIEINCEKSSIDPQRRRLIVSGRNVKMSHVLVRTRWPQACRGKALQELSVLGMERVYFDVDVSFKGKELHVYILAPVWIVPNGNRSISLDGTQPPNMADARDGIEMGDSGTGGADGAPGSNAGSFFGICSKTENGNRLSISTSGGNGGKGQNGGDGREGRPGADATYDDFPTSYYPLTGGGSNLLDGYYENGVLVYKAVLIGVYNKAWHSLKGGTGRDGGNGGRGGNGGTSGIAGSVELTCSKSGSISSPFRTTARRGEGGEPGWGGKGGKGGFNGNHYSCKRNQYAVFYSNWRDCYADRPNPRERTGGRGADGGIGNKGTVREEYNQVAKHGAWRSINEYRTTFFGNKSMIMNLFCKELDSNLETIRFQEVASLLDEVTRLEEKFFGMRVNNQEKKELYRSYYDTFLSRLGNQLDNPSESDKLALNLIYSAVLGKLTSMKRSGERLNVINAKDYFDALIPELMRLKNLHKEKAIQEECSRFKEKLDEKVREAQGFVKDIVQPAIEDANRAMEGASEHLLREINQFLNETELDVQKQKRLKGEYESARFRSIAMGMLSTVGAAASFLGPWGTVAGQVISTGVSLANTVAPANIPKRPRGSLILPTTVVNSLATENKDYFKKRIDLAEKKINMALEAGKMASDNILQDVTSKAQQARNSLDPLKDAMGNKIRIDLTTISTIHDLEKKVNELSITSSDLAEQLGSGKGEGINPVTEAGAGNVRSDAERREARNAVIIKNVATAMRTADAVQDLVLTALDSAAESERLTALIKEAEQKVEAVQAKKNNFCDNFLPQLSSINEDIKKETSGIVGQSQAGLLVKKWKMKGLLKNMRGFINQFTREMKVAEEFEVGFDKLDEALILMIDLYDHIEAYEEKKELADFITNVNAASGIKSQISDSDIRSNLDRLEFFIHANIFLQEYETALRVFKQWVFPFASHYLNGKDHDRYLETPMSLDQVVNIYKNKVERLATELAKYMATTERRDESLVVSAFTSGYVSSEPFYVWTNDLWKTSIKKLLAGEKVYLRADVDMSHQNPGQADREFFQRKGAIKFKSIELSFRSRNVTRQAELDERLKDFGMKMTHSGISIYKVKGQHFVMFDRNQTYRYSFERRVGDQQHVTQNVIKYKVEGSGADFLMSPYTWWTFQLTDAKPRVGMGFSNLAEFEQEVDLELEGEGVYLDELNAPPCILDNLNLADHYEVYDPDATHMEIIEDGMCCDEVKQQDSISQTPAPPSALVD